MLVYQVPQEAPDQLNLLVDGEFGNDSFHDAADSGPTHSADEGVIVNIGKETHDKLAVHAVGNAAVAGDRVAKVLELEGTFESRGKKTSKRGNDGSEGSPKEGMNLYRGHGDAKDCTGWEKKELGSCVSLGNENWVGLAFQSSKDCRAQIVGRAGEIFGPREQVGEQSGKDGRHNPCANEALHRFLGRELNKLGPAKRDSTDVGPDIVGDDQGRGEKEPEHSLKHIVHDKMRLHNDEEQRDVGPAKLSKLKFEVSCLE